MKAWIFGFGLLAVAVTAQALPVLDWMQCYTDASGLRCTDARQTADGGFILAGYCREADLSHTDHCVLRLDSAGHRLWFRTYGDPTRNEQAFAIGQTSDGGYYLAGIRVGFGMELVRLDSACELLWTQFHTFANLIQPSDQLHGVVTLDDGMAVSGGYFSAAGDARVVRFDAQGALLWARSYGGAAYDCALGLRRLPNGDLLVPG